MRNGLLAVKDFDVINGDTQVYGLYKGIFVQLYAR